MLKTGVTYLLIVSNISVQTSESLASGGQGREACVRRWRGYRQLLLTWKTRSPDIRRREQTGRRSTG